MEGKFLGIGLYNAVGLWCLFVVLSVMAKVIFTKYHVDGISEVILTGA